MAQTTSTSSNYPNFPSEYIRKDLLEKGSRSLAYHNAAMTVPFPEGSGKLIRFGRYDAVEVAIDTLTEGVNPTPQALTLSQVEATLAQYGKSIQVTDLHEMTVMHPTFQQAIDELRRSLEDSRDYQLQNTINAESNVIYAGGNTARVDLDVAGGDLITTEEIRRVNQKLKNPDGKGRAAIRYGDGRYLMIHHTHLEQDMLSDTTFEFQATRLLPKVKDLEEGTFGIWGGFTHVSTNFSPEIYNIGDPTLASGVAVVQGDVDGNWGPGGTGPSDLVGFTATTTTGGSLTGGATYDLTVTAIDKCRGFEERISGVMPFTLGGGDNRVAVVYPSDAGKVYNLYAGASGGTRYLVDSFSEAGASFNLDSIPGSGDTAPDFPAEGETVYFSHGMGREAVAKVEHSVDDVLISQGPDSFNNLAMYRTVGYKYLDANIVLNPNWLWRIEAVSTFS